jgi:squalene-hopene/tetraprenyl-beta-curcumene cyclase
MKSIGLLLALSFSFLSAFAAEEPLAQDEKNVSFRNEIRAAMERGMEWLKAQQNPDGSFGSDTTHPALSALPMVALQRDPLHRYSDCLPKSYAYLRSFAQPDGGIYNPEKGLANYNTSIALMALAASKAPEDLALVLSARNYVIGQQASGMAKPETDGGIGYGSIGASPKRGHPDLDNTLVALEALKATESLAADKPATKQLNWNAAIAFVTRCQNLKSHNKEAWASDDQANKGGFVYYPGASNAGSVELPDGQQALRSSGSMSYAGLLSFIYADLKANDPRVHAALEWLQSNYTLEENPGLGLQGHYYYLHLMTKALSAAGVSQLTLKDGKTIDWNRELSHKLLNLQQTDGSWSNSEARWMEKNPALVTAYCVLSLQIIYHQL